MLTMFWQKKEISLQNPGTNVRIKSKVSVSLYPRLIRPGKRKNVFEKRNGNYNN